MQAGLSEQKNQLFGWLGFQMARGEKLNVTFSQRSNYLPLLTDLAAVGEMIVTKSM